MTMKKAGKAVSPLIATILLVAVALAIAGILYSWSQTYIVSQTTQISQVTQSQIDCSYATIQLSDCSSSASGISLIIDSVGSSDFINGFKIYVLDAQGKEASGLFDFDLNAGAFKLANTRNLSNLRDFEALSLPLAKLRITPVVCPEKFMELDNC